MHQRELMRFYEGHVLSARNRNGKELKAFHNKPLERAEELVWLNNEQIVSELLVLVYAKIRVAIRVRSLTLFPKFNDPDAVKRNKLGN
jgi:hypothetical protein